MNKELYAIDLFSGTGSFANVASAHGYDVDTYDNDPKFGAVEQHSILEIGLEEFTDQANFGVDVLWASPPCQGFSVAAIGKNWCKETRAPKSDSARLGLALLQKTIDIIATLQPERWYIENPRGMMRKVIEPMLAAAGLDSVRHTVGYCSYGDTRQKPTDIWTNDSGWKSKPLCAPKSSCHVSAPRGSKTGTQGLKGAAARGVVPAALIREILG